MRYVRYGIVLERLSEKYLELVRLWRNREFVRARMQFRDEIGSEAQRAWFLALHPENDWYFVASRAGTPFGLFHVKNIDWQEKSGEAGAFVGEETYIEGLDPASAVLALMEFAFLQLNLDSLTAKYHPQFASIARMNSQLGYEIFAAEEDGFVRARVTKDRFFERARPLLAAAERLHGKDVIIETDDP